MKKARATQRSEKERSIFILHPSAFILRDLRARTVAENRRNANPGTNIGASRSPSAMTKATREAPSCPPQPA